MMLNGTQLDLVLDKSEEVFLGRVRYKRIGYVLVVDNTAVNRYVEAFLDPDTHSVKTRREIEGPEA